MDRRSPFECFCRYQRSLNPRLVRGAIAADDDVSLHALVARMGEYQWPRLAARLVAGYRDEFLRQRYLKSKYPPRGITTYEHNAIAVLYEVYGQRWEHIACHLPAMSGMKVRDRWDTQLRPGLAAGRFSREELEQLLEGVRAEGAGNWTRIKAHVPGRSDAQCWRVWQAVCPEEGGVYDTLLAAKALMLPSNFANRRDQRSRVTAADFEMVEPKLEDGRWSTGHEVADSHLRRVNPRPKRTKRPAAAIVDGRPRKRRSLKPKKKAAEKEDSGKRGGGFQEAVEENRQPNGRKSKKGARKKMEEGEVEVGEDENGPPKAKKSKKGAQKKIEAAEEVKIEEVVVVEEEAEEEVEEEAEGTRRRIGTP